MRNKRRKEGKKESLKNKYKINDSIKHREIRVIEGVDPGVYSLEEALLEADRLDLDLVLINEKANPPICKILDFDKFIYKEKQKIQQSKQNQNKTVLKEIRLSPNIGDNDFEVKRKKAQKFLESGNKVKATLMFKGRNIVFKERGELVLLNFAKQLSEVGDLEAMPKLNGRNMNININPKKKNG